MAAKFVPFLGKCLKQEDSSFVNILHTLNLDILHTRACVADGSNADDVLCIHQRCS